MKHPVTTASYTDKVKTKAKGLPFYERIFYKALASAKKGQLRVIKENGECFILGEGLLRAEIWIKDKAFFKKAVLFGDVGFGEAYVDGMWDSPDVLAVLKWFAENAATTPTFAQSAAHSLLVNSLGFLNYLQHLRRPNSIRKARENIQHHYDLSNELYQLMLDKSMAYSCALFLSEKDSLEKAQKRKYEIICQKLNLQKGHHILEIGSGWGGFALYAAKNYGVKVTTITISKEQFRYVADLIKKENIEHLIEVRFEDYRKTKGKFDRIVSIEMMEALGYRYYDIFFSQINNLLKPEGLVLLQCITYPDASFHKYRRRSDWIQKYIFPGSLLLSLHEMRRSLLRTSDLEIYDIESMGQSYVKTLKAWQDNFNRKRNKVLSLGFDERFLRMWNYYLWYCQAGFESRYINVIQILLSRPQNPALKDFHALG
ncbi:MAG: cyclopropane-fatty-acyl-phospholipid synthase family protein [Leptospiraceae bacterium]|nr:cyclopropane-fatty-acyl-phospholipid synthase family protein [Leptospiraceae bacterium]MDW8305800.1 cyclopropane-fatty-acyl-phospholipid synthase family protein [Leptospiraceae bacterium]